MPIKKCTVDGKPGYKFGDKGKCYPNREDAVKQGRAIQVNKEKVTRKKK